MLAGEEQCDVGALGSSAEHIALMCLLLSLSELTLHQQPFGVKRGREMRVPGLLKLVSEFGKTLPHFSSMLEVDRITALNQVVHTPG